MPPGDGKARILGAGHPDTVSTRSNLDFLLRRKNNQDQPSRGQPSAPRIWRATADANPTGTALPICRASSIFEPHHA